MPSSRCFLSLRDHFPLSPDARCFENYCFMSFVFFISFFMWEGEPRPCYLILARSASQPIYLNHCLLDFGKNAPISYKAINHFWVIQTSLKLLNWLAPRADINWKKKWLEFIWGNRLTFHFFVDLFFSYALCWLEGTTHDISVCPWDWWIDYFEVS